MRILVVLRSSEPQVQADLMAAAAPLGEVAALDLTGTANVAAAPLYRVTGEADLTIAANAAAAIEAAVAACQAEVILVDASLSGREIAGYAAGLLGCAMIADAEAVWSADGAVHARRTVLAGSWTTECASDGRVMITVIPGGQGNPDAGEAGQVEELAVAAVPAGQAVTVLSRQAQELGDEIPLEGAEIVVCGGRGVEGDFTLVRELAEQLGAAVGATRVCTDEGWIDHHAQIGQTGVTVRPRIYIGVGVSGAVHHTVGMQNSEIIVAINDDSEAPIFEIADYGVVGDLNEVVPQLLQALRS